MRANKKGLRVTLLMLTCGMLKEPLLIGPDIHAISRGGNPSVWYCTHYAAWCCALAEEHVRTFALVGSPKSQLLVEIGKRHGGGRRSRDGVREWQRAMLERAEKQAWERARCR